MTSSNPREAEVEQLRDQLRDTQYLVHTVRELLRTLDGMAPEATVPVRQVRDTLRRPLAQLDAQPARQDPGTADLFPPDHPDA